MPTTAGATLTITPRWSGAKRRTYFNAFDLDRSEKGFVISRFAFVRWGECVDCTTIILTQALLDFGRESLLQYVKGVGLQAVDYEGRMPEIPRSSHGVIRVRRYYRRGAIRRCWRDRPTHIFNSIRNRSSQHQQTSSNTRIYCDFEIKYQSPDQMDPRSLCRQELS